MALFKKFPNATMPNNKREKTNIGLFDDKGKFPKLLQDSVVFCMTILQPFRMPTKNTQKNCLIIFHTNNAFKIFFKHLFLNRIPRDIINLQSVIFIL